MRLVPGILIGILLCASPRASGAQTFASVADNSRFFVDVGVAGSATFLAPAREYSRPFIIYGENASMGVSYPKPSRDNGFQLDLGGGFMLKPWLGIGASYSRASYEVVAGLEATIPHPFVALAPATGIGVTNEALTFRESATHVFVAWVPLRWRWGQLRVMGGPTFFQWSADMVQEVLYQHDFALVTPDNIVTITGSTNQHVTGSSVGFHVGGDYSYFFTSMFGVGGGVRHSVGTVTVDPEPMTQLSQSLRVGTTLVFVSVRVRFGR